MKTLSGQVTVLIHGLRIIAVIHCLIVDSNTGAIGTLPVFIWRQSR